MWPRRRRICLRGRENSKSNKHTDAYLGEDGSEAWKKVSAAYSALLQSLYRVVTRSRGPAGRLSLRPSQPAELRK